MGIEQVLTEIDEVVESWGDAARWSPEPPSDDLVTDPVVRPLAAELVPLDGWARLASRGQRDIFAVFDEHMQLNEWQMSYLLRAWEAFPQRFITGMSVADVARCRAYII